MWGVAAYVLVMSMISRSFFSFSRVVTALVVLGLLISIPAVAQIPAVASFFGGGKGGAASTYRTAAVVKGSIAKSITDSGTAQFQYDQKLRFYQSGTITGVHVKAGDTVKRGDVIAQLDDSTLQNNINKSQIDIQNARLDLVTTQYSVEASTLLKAQDTVTQAEKTLDASKDQYDLILQKETQDTASAQTNVDNAGKDVVQAQNAVNIAKDALANQGVYATNTVDTLNRTETQAVSDAQLVYTQTLTKADSVLHDLNSVLIQDTGTTSSYASFLPYLGALDSTLLSKANDAYSAARQKLLQLKTQTPVATLDGVKSALKDADALTQVLFTAADATHSVLVKSVSNAAFTQSTLDSITALTASDRDAAKTQESTVENNLNALANLANEDVVARQNSDALQAKQQTLDAANLTLKKDGDTVRTLQQTLDTVKAQYVIDKQNQQNTIQANTDALAVAQQALVETERGAKSETLDQKQNAIRQAEIALEAMKSQEVNYQIIAPFDGVIESIDFKTGDQIVTNDSTNEEYVYVQNPDLITLNVPMDQVDAVKVSVGQKAKVVFDALPDKPMDGAVSQISTVPVTSNGVVSYNVTVVPDNGSTTIYPGMTAQVTIISASKDDILIVPSVAITTSNSKSTVRVLESTGVPQVVTVTVGITDGSHTEITSGLTEGQQVITFEKKVAMATAAQTTSIIPTGGPGAGGGGGARAGGAAGGGGGGGRPGG